MRLLASFTAGDNGNLASRRQVRIESAQDLLDHKHITTAQITIEAAVGAGLCLAQGAELRNVAGATSKGD